MIFFPHTQIDCPLTQLLLELIFQTSTFCFPPLLPPLSRVPQLQLYFKGKLGKFENQGMSFSITARKLVRSK